MRSHLFNVLLKNVNYTMSNPSIIGVQEGTTEQCNDILDMLNDRWNSNSNIDSKCDSLNSLSCNSNYRMIAQGRSIGNQWGSQTSEWHNEQCCIFFNDNLFDLLDYGTFWLSTTPNIPNTLASMAKYPRYV